MARAPVTAVVTTLDNAATLDACLASLAFCDELVVLDSGSRDGTEAIARARRALVRRTFQGLWAAEAVGGRQGRA